MSDQLLSFTDANFQAEVLHADQTVLVDFTAEWCPPCKMLKPMMDRLAGEYAGRAKIGTLDADANRETMLQYGVDTLPRVIVFRQGQVVAQFRGLRQEREYREALEQSTRI